MKPIPFISFALILACVSASVLATSPSPADLAQYDTAVKDAMHWGRLMFDHDQAARKATDIVLKDRSALADKRYQGWITETSDSGIRVVFVGEENGKFVALYETTPSSQSDFIVNSPSRELTVDELAEFNARRTATTAFNTPCTDRYNPVVLPDGSGEGRKWRVYLIPGSTVPDLIPLGGYYQYEISGDGKTILGQRAFTKSCLSTSTKGGPSGYHLAYVTVSHLMDPEPTEVHVFVSLTYKQKLFVVTTTNNRVWSVSDGYIRDGGDYHPELHPPMQQDAAKS